MNERVPIIEGGKHRHFKDFAGAYYSDGSMSVSVTFEQHRIAPNPNDHPGIVKMNGKTIGTIYLCEYDELRRKIIGLDQFDTTDERIEWVYKFLRGEHTTE